MTFDPHDCALAIVDDDASVRASLARLLKTERIDPQAYESAEEFLALSRNCQGPACALIDIGLPGMSGLDLHARLARERPEIAVVVLTGHGDVPGAVASMKRGAVDFLQKPVDAATLMEALGRAFSRAREAWDALGERDRLTERYGALTRREREVMTHVIAGKRNKVIAGELGTTEKTVKVHRGRIMEKMGVKSVAELVRCADRLAIAPAPVAAKAAR